MTRVADRVVAVTVRGPLTSEHTSVLRNVALAQLARYPRMLIAEFAPSTLTAGTDVALRDGAVRVLTEIATEAGSVDIGLCLVVPSDRMASIVESLDAAGVRELFEIHPTIAAALDSLP